jgi:hypothetical protein
MRTQVARKHLADTRERTVCGKNKNGYHDQTSISHRVNIGFELGSRRIDCAAPDGTLMHDAQYRLSVAWQNVAYNQPPHTSFFMGEGMAKPPRPAIVTPTKKAR